MVEITSLFGVKSISEKLKQRHAKRAVRREEKQAMKLGKPDDNRVIVSVKTSKRDMRKTVKDAKTGKEIENPTFDRIVYETHQSIDVFEATAADVTKIVRDALERAEKK